jgi:CDP-glucose 4,6-dehydratase
MDMIEELRTSLKGKRVLVTGHTGFKGSWLSIWLNRLGALSYGFSLSAPSEPSMFALCGVEEDINHLLGDIRDLRSLQETFLAVMPDLVIHMAAQPLVRQSYIDPMDTLTSNVIGTANVLEAVRAMDRACAVVVVSSDKCYENQEWVWGYRENDPMGGKDPYSMSKGATELVVSSWRSSYFEQGGQVKLASARAGNVIGGGDWAKDRIVPDCIRAFVAGESVELRNPGAIRPWQHVLEPLGGYLLLACRLLGDTADQYCSGWNFGPAATDVKTVEYVVAGIAARLGRNSKWVPARDENVKEAMLLSLNCDKAISKLGWRPTWAIDEVIEKTASWYNSWYNGCSDIRAQTISQIAQFETDSSIGAQ